MNSFNSLPPEVQVEIFSYLSFDHVMKIRRVCKQWKNLINSEFKSKRLRCCIYYWPSDRQKGKDFCFRSSRTFLESNNHVLKFSRVKYLNASLCHYYRELEDAFDFLNSFESLEELHFKCYLRDKNLYSVKTRFFVVILNHLKKAILYFYWYELNVALNLPNLHHLHLDSFKGIILSHPEKLRILETDNLIQSGTDFSKFTNLTEIYSDSLSLRAISADFINKLSSLRKVCLGDYVHNCYRLYNQEECRLPEPPLSGKSKLRIFCLGFEIKITIDQINQISKLDLNSWPHPNFVDKHFTRFATQNLYRSIDNNPYVTSVYYNTMISELRKLNDSNESEMFRKMLQKFSKIDCLYTIGTVADPSRLLKVAQKAKCLYFKSTSLPRSFFEQLAENCPLVQKLHIHLEPKLNIQSGDFNFIFKMEKLSLIHIDSPLSLKFLARLYKEHNSMHCVSFYQHKNYELIFYHSLNIYFSDFVDRFPELSLSNKRTGLELVNILKNRLGDGLVCPNELLAQLISIRFERKNYRFIKKMYAYQLKNSIFLPKEQILPLFT